MASSSATRAWSSQSESTCRPCGDSKEGSRGERENDLSKHTSVTRVASREKSL